MKVIFPLAGYTYVSNMYFLVVFEIYKHKEH